MRSCSIQSVRSLPRSTAFRGCTATSKSVKATSVQSSFQKNMTSTAKTTAAASFPAGNATHGWQHRKMKTADVLFEVPGQKLRQDMLYELIFLKLVTANALCSRSFSCKGRSYFCHISHDTRKPAEPYVLRVSKE